MDEEMHASNFQKRNMKKCYEMNADYMYLLQIKSTWTSLGYQAQLCYHLTDHQETYHQDLVDHPNSFIMIRVTLLH